MTTHPHKIHLLRLLEDLKAQGYQFITVTPLSHERVNSRPGNEWARSLRDVFGWNRPFHDGLLPQNMFELLKSAQALSAFEDGWRSLVRVSSLDEHLFIHSSFPTTEADAVFFGPDTYRYVSAIHEHLKNSSAVMHRIADIGCGSGAGAIAAALAVPEATVFALDINDQALALTDINACAAGTGNVVPFHSNILKQAEGEFDLIMANPPYLVDGSHRAYRDGGGAMGAELSLAIVEESVRRLSDRGTLLLYTGVAIVQGRDMFRAEVEKRLSKEFELDYAELDPDIFGEELLRDCYREVDRIACVLLTITRKSGSPA